MPTLPGGHTLDQVDKEERQRFVRNVRWFRERMASLGWRGTWEQEIGEMIRNVDWTSFITYNARIVLAADPQRFGLNGWLDD